MEVPLSSISAVAEVTTLKPAFTSASPISVGVAYGAVPLTASWFAVNGVS